MSKLIYFLIISLLWMVIFPLDFFEMINQTITFFLNKNNFFIPVEQ